MQNISFSQLAQSVDLYEHFIVDKAVFELHKEDLSFLKSKKTYYIEDPEASKSMTCFETITNFFLESGISRSDTIVAIGGGATTDLSGFVASTVLRGVEWVSVPTTLLAMIDASIGGKVGINSRFGKNLIGQFHLPIDTYFCFKFLDTLDSSELESGKGELLKYCFLDKEIKQSCLENGYTTDLIFQCAKFKMSIVENDLKESGKRAILNYGHTIGHAIEKLSSFPHGLSVAKGIEFNIKLFSNELLEELYQLCTKLGVKLPNKLSLDSDKFYELIKSDKKNKSNSQVGFIVIDPRPVMKHIELNELKKRIESSDVQNDLF